jgi:phospholipid/cholesterol/gamma-HCH transport system substrate-binding protein
MKRTIKIKWGEIKVGLLIAAAIAVLLWASFSGGGTSIFESKMKYRAYFPNVNGLVKGSPVWLAGIEVGNVYSVKFVNLDSLRQIEVKFRVVKSAQKMLTTDATIKIGTIGFIGDKYVEITPGTLTSPVLEEGSVVASVPPGDLASVFAEGEKTVMAAGDLTRNLTDITGRLRRGEGSAGRLFADDTLYNEMTRMLAALTVLINDMQRSQGKIVSSLESMSQNLDGITGKVNTNQGTLGRIISDPGVYDRLHSSAGRIDSILAKINQGDGTAGAMVNDDELYQEIKNLIVRIENLVTDIEKNPRKYFKFSVF